VISSLLGIGINLIPSSEQNHCELAGFELCVEFFGQVHSMTRIAERYFFVLGSRILSQHTAGFEVDWFVVEKHSPDTITGQNLFSLVVVFVGVFNQHLWFGSAHCVLLDLFI
jgi:hypothetical protein